MSLDARGQGAAGAASQADHDYYQAWFGRLAAEIGQLDWGVLWAVQGDEIGAQLSGWFASAGGEVESGALRLAREAVADREGRFAPLGARQGGQGETWLLAYPVLAGREVLAVVLLCLAVTSGAGLQQAMQRMQWSSAWIALRLRGAEAGPGGVTFALELLANLLDRDRPELAGIALVQALARQAGQGRVSFGWVAPGRKPDRLKLVAISDVTEFDPRMNEVRLIEAAMKEAIAAGMPLVWPAPQALDAPVWPAHDALLRGGGGPAIATYPLLVRHEPVGAVCFESDDPAQRVDDDGARLASALALSAGVLRLQQQAATSAWRRAADVLRAQLHAFFGPEAYRRKTAVALTMLLVLFFAFKEGDYRLTGEAVIEPDFQRLLTAPYNGYLAEAKVRPGDLVKAGDTLASLDERDLRLERVRWLTERDKLQRKQQEAIAAYERASVNILSAQLEQASAQLELVESQLERAVIKAPFDALVVSGDPAQKLGAVLQKGDTLYQVAPRDAYRVLVRIPEARIADAVPGMKGSLQLSSVPGLALGLELRHIHPFSERHEGASYFPAEAVLHGETAQLRPGMQGIASLEAGRRNLLGIWTRGLVEWLRLKWWSIAG